MSETSAIDPQQVLDALMPQPNDAQAVTVGDYLHRLLSTLWDESDEFSGKHPFGNSGWEYDLYAALILAGLLDGDVEREDQEFYVNECDSATGHQLVAAAIDHLFGRN